MQGGQSTHRSDFVHLRARGTPGLLRVGRLAHLDLHSSEVHCDINAEKFKDMEEHKRNEEEEKGKQTGILQLAAQEVNEPQVYVER